MSNSRSATYPVDDVHKTEMLTVLGMKDINRARIKKRDQYDSKWAASDTIILSQYETCVKIPNTFGIMDLQDPRSQMLVNAGSYIFILLRGSKDAA